MEKTVSQPSLRPKPVLAGNTCTGTLKLIALVFMFIDHSGKMLFDNAPIMRSLGRIAFPIYCWCLVVGFCYTRSPLKYVLRVFLVGVISQPLYMIALNHTWRDPNIFLTLMLALCALWGIREKKYFSHIWAPLLAMVLAVETGADYGWRGVLLVILLYAARESKGAIAAVVVAMTLYWGATESAMSSLLGVSLTPLSTWRYGSLTTFMRKMSSWKLFSLLFILIPIKKNVRLPKWLGYAIYPLHLVLLWALEQIF